MNQKTIDYLPNFSGYKPDVVCFKTGSPRQNGLYDGVYGFEDVTIFGPSALYLFSQRILLGDVFPSIMYINEVNTLDRAMAVLLFDRPELVNNPRTMQWVFWIDLYERLGIAGYSAMEESAYYRCEEWSRRLQEKTFPKLLKIVEEIRKDILMYQDSEDFPEDLELLEIREPFLYYRSPKAHWRALYRLGYLGGIWESPEGPIAFKKSVLVKDLNLNVLRNIPAPAHKKPSNWELLDDACVLRPLQNHPGLGFRMWTKLKSYLNSGQ